MNEAVDAIGLVVVAPELIVAGVMRILRGHAHRVRVIDRADTGARVGLVDPLRMAPEAVPNGLPLLVLADDVAEPALVAPVEALRRRGLDVVGTVSPRAGAADLVEAVARADRERADRRAVTGPVLTPREGQVLALIARGLSNAQIGAELHLSINSVKTHVRTAYRKVGVRTRSQAVLWVLEQGGRPPTWAGPMQSVSS